MVEIEMPHGYVAVIDDEDEARVREHRWRPLIHPHTVYAIARLPRLAGKQRSIYMHRLVVEAKPSEWIEHLDRNGLNNTCKNLRVRAVAPSGIGPHADGPSSAGQGEGTRLQSGVTFRRRGA